MAHGSQDADYFVWTAVERRLVLRGLGLFVVSVLFAAIGFVVGRSAFLFAPRDPPISVAVTPEKGSAPYVDPRLVSPPVTILNPGASEIKASNQTLAAPTPTESKQPIEDAVSGSLLRSPAQERVHATPSRAGRDLRQQNAAPNYMALRDQLLRGNLRN